MIVTLDLETEEWAFDLEDLNKRYRDHGMLYFNFTKNGKQNVSFKQLSFGFDIKIDDEVIYSDTFPKGNMRYAATDQEYVDSYIIEEIKADRDYSLFVWAINNNEEYFEVFNFNIPKPKQPSPLWIWNDEQNAWDPPMETASLQIAMQEKLDKQ